MSQLISRKEAFLAASGNSTGGSDAAQAEPERDTFWEWFFRAGRTKAGWRRLINKWCILHVLVGVFLAWIVKGNLKDAASSVLLPLVGVLVGLSFAWAGNAQSLLQTPEIDELSDYHPGGLQDFAFTYQAAILAILSCVTLWGLAGLGVFDHRCFWSCSTRWYFAVAAALYGSLSLTIRESWHVVLGAQRMLLMRSKKQRIDRESK